jgi:hypothetical protein
VRCGERSRTKRSRTDQKAPRVSHCRDVTCYVSTQQKQHPPNPKTKKPCVSRTPSLIRSIPKNLRFPRSVAQFVYRTRT